MFIKKFLVLVLFIFLTAANAFALELFKTEAAAQKHCPKDKVVWLNLPSGIYHYKGDRWYGNTKKGAFVCEKETRQDGKRASKEN